MQQDIPFVITDDLYSLRFLASDSLIERDERNCFSLCISISFCLATYQIFKMLIYVLILISTKLYNNNIIPNIGTPPDLFCDCNISFSSCDLSAQIRQLMAILLGTFYKLKLAGLVKLARWSRCHGHVTRVASHVTRS